MTSPASARSDDDENVRAPEPNYRKAPCPVCPIRSDNCHDPLARFPRSRWEALTRTVPDGHDGQDVPLEAPMFSCHKGHPGTGEPTVCAGWAAVFGVRHIRLRLAAVRGMIPWWLLDAAGRAGWPPLHRTWAEVREHHTWRPGDYAGHLNPPPTPEDLADS